MRVRHKVAVVGAVLVAVGIGGAGSVSAVTVTLVTPTGKTVVAPAAATAGVLTAATSVFTNGPVDLPIDLVIT